MSSLIYTGVVVGKAVRFFNSPVDDGPDLPWKSIADLQAGVRLPLEYRLRQRHTDYKEVLGDDDARLILTSGEPTWIMSHPACHGFIHMAIDKGWASGSLWTEYAAALAKAFFEENRDRSPEAAMSWMTSALARHEYTPDMLFAR